MSPTSWTGPGSRWPAGRRADRLSSSPALRIWPRAVERGAAFVLIDLAHAGVLEVLPRLRRAHTVGFASHVDKALLAAAREAGCDEVLPRSAVFRRLARTGDES